jgi:hypothetical protein
VHGFILRSNVSNDPPNVLNILTTPLPLSTRPPTALSLLRERREARGERSERKL